MEVLIMRFVVYLILGLAIIVFGLIPIIKVLSYTKIRAKCINTEKDKIIGSVVKGYKSEFVFKYDGEVFKTSESNWLGSKLEPGEEYEIHINPKNPFQIFTKSQIRKNWFFIVFGIIIVVSSILRICYFINSFIVE